MTRRPTHVLVYDEKNNESWPMSLEDFAKLFSPGTHRCKDTEGRWGERSIIRVNPPVDAVGSAACEHMTALAKKHEPVG